MAVTCASCVNFSRVVTLPHPSPPLIKGRGPESTRSIINHQLSTNYLVGCTHRSLQSLEMVPPVETTTDSAGGGSAQTLSAVGNIAKAAISP